MRISDWSSDVCSSDLPTLLLQDPANPPHGEQVISARTSEQMRDLMRLGVVKGTGSKANAKGYLVGGKTGTADKAMGRGYARNARIASFVGAFPMDAPRYVVFAMVAEPQPPKETYGSAPPAGVAAPLAGPRTRAH